MIDFHTHILPEIDDGSRSVDMSIEMLKTSAQGGVEAVLATPHFYADKQRPEEFLEKRWASYEQLVARREGNAPSILLGAEVYYFDGMSLTEQMRELCIRGSDLLLLEMPFNKWTQRMLDEVRELCFQQELTVILAHIERYIDDQPEKLWRSLQNDGILLQVNANFFIRPKTRRKALAMLASGEIDLLGSDCHNMTSRFPNMAEAMQVIETGVGPDAADALVDRGRGLMLAHRLS